MNCHRNDILGIVSDLLRVFRHQIFRAESEAPRGGTARRAAFRRRKSVVSSHGSEVIAKAGSGAAKSKAARAKRRPMRRVIG